jgi:hypothetical protein
MRLAHKAYFTFIFISVKFQVCPLKKVQVQIFLAVDKMSRLKDNKYRTVS